MGLGIIKLSIILIFDDKDKNFTNRKSFYYTALKYLNTEENNIKGINLLRECMSFFFFTFLNL